MTITAATQQSSSLTAEIETDTTDCQTVWRCHSPSVTGPRTPVTTAEQNVKLVGECFGADAKRRSPKVRSLFNLPSWELEEHGVKDGAEPSADADCTAKSLNYPEGSYIYFNFHENRSRAIGVDNGPAPLTWPSLNYRTYSTVLYLLFSFAVLVIVHAYYGEVRSKCFGKEKSGPCTLTCAVPGTTDPIAMFSRYGVLDVEGGGDSDAG